MESSVASKSQPGVPGTVLAGARPGRVALPRLGVAAVTWQAFLASRLLIWLVGGLAVLHLGVWTVAERAFDAAGIGRTGTRLGDLVLAPAVRWDAVWYIDIARHGYHTATDTSFSPLLPILIRGLGALTGDLRIAGLIIALGACLAALETVRRLAEHELGVRAARRTVMLLAFGPMSVFLSAVYTDGLFVALSAGAFLSARRGRWSRAGGLGALAALARPAGVLLVVPLAVLFLYGPRDDASAGPTAVRPANSARLTRWRLAPALARWRPRFPLTREAGWLGLVVASPCAFALYLRVRGYGAAATITAQRRYMHHSITPPWIGAWDGVRASSHAIVGILAGSHAADGTQVVIQGLGLIVIVCAVVGTFRRLPLAYGLTAMLPLLLHLSSPSHGDPLKGLSRYASLRFPLFMWAASWSLERGVPGRAIAGSAILMCLFAAQFATWHMVASLLL